jgi:hypothetical protein
LVDRWGEEGKPMTREELFETFWKAYPRKVGKTKCLNWFKSKSRKVDEKLLDEMLTAIREQKKTKQWQTKQFIPHPYTWLNQGRWEDEIEVENDELDELRKIVNEKAKKMGRLI